ncbi:NAD(P)-binding protein [Diaporthe amygdali]|uniref:NAD(P)-binding protein n=1 Tax=Phomopsis amygdali TaxID=1214568 RepID=UPI0022FECFAD|nr:NAD(P)-binding protein [Diaporthe amygdali]KAJ0107128.1 NAD(P)-binding protein [Diaporthe amygdali]
MSVAVGVQDNCLLRSRSYLASVAEAYQFPKGHPDIKDPIAVQVEPLFVFGHSNPCFLSKSGHLKLQQLCSTISSTKLFFRSKSDESLNTITSFNPQCSIGTSQEITEAVYNGPVPPYLCLGSRSPG